MRSSYRRLRRFGLLVLPLVAALSLSGCGDVLDVVAPGILTSEELEGPESVPVAVAGLINDFQSMLEDYILYEGLFTDEFILAGTFPTRFDVDERNIRASNGSVLGDVYEPLNVARFTADTGAVRFATALEKENFGLDDPTQSELDAQETRLREGLANARLRAGYARILLGEMFCQSAIAGNDPEGSEARMEDALGVLQQAETEANEAGLDDVEAAAIVGQARAQLWLATMGAGGVTWADVQTTANRVPASFTAILAERDANSAGEYNEVYATTWGDNWSLRWTVGDGSENSRHNERFTYYTEWETLERIVTDAEGAGLTGEAFNENIQVNAQMEYTSFDDDIPFASQAEADMIEAEALIRMGGAANLAQANGLVNPYRVDWGLAPLDLADPGSFDLAALGLDAAGTYTDLQIQLAVLAREKLRETWLQGTRLGELRRLLASPGIDLFPTGTVGDQTCFPLPEQETTGA